MILIFPSVHRLFGSFLIQQQRGYIKYSRRYSDFSNTILVFVYLLSIIEYVRASIRIVAC